MIVTRTPFRITLGGGGTDLPSYYTKYGGFIFGVAVNIYFDVVLRKPLISKKIRLQYNAGYENDIGYEETDSAEKIQHGIGREALKIAGIRNGIDITFISDHADELDPKIAKNQRRVP